MWLEGGRQRRTETVVRGGDRRRDLFRIVGEIVDDGDAVGVLAHDFKPLADAFEGRKRCVDGFRWQAEIQLFDDGENSACVDGAVEAVLRRCNMTELFGIEDDAVLRRFEIEWRDAVGIVGEKCSAEGGNSSRAETCKVFQFIEDDCLLALAEEVAEDGFQFVLPVVVVSDVQKDADVRMEGGQRTVGFIDFNDDVFRIVVSGEVAGEARPFGIELIAACDH